MWTLLGPLLLCCAVFVHLWAASDRRRRDIDRMVSVAVAMAVALLAIALHPGAPNPGGARSVFCEPLIGRAPEMP